MAERGENCLIAMAGAPTVLTNSVIAGVLDEVGQGVHIVDVFGATAGVAGIAEGKLIDLGAQKRKTIEGLQRTPGSILTGRHRVLTAEEGTNLVEVLRANEIGYLFLLGGLPALGLMQFISDAAEKQEYPLVVLGAPLSSENEVNAGDHTPGFGSAARHVAGAVRDAGIDAASAQEPLLVVEVLGAQTGWLAAASALARDDEFHAPHAIVLPERPVEAEALVDELRRAYQKWGNAVVVTTEGARDAAGNSLAGNELHKLLEEKIGVPARLEKIGATARSAQDDVARADSEEAYNMGALLVRLSDDECTGYLAAVNRDSHVERGDRGGYRSIEGTTRLDQAGNEPRLLPTEYIAENGLGVTQAFLDWARPLIGGPLPEYVTLTQE